MKKEKKKALLELQNSGYINEARLLEALDKVKFGRVVIVMVGGQVDRIEEIIKYDKMSKGL